MEAVDTDTPPPNLHVALSIAANVLGVMCDANHLSILDITHGGSVLQVRGARCSVLG